MTVFPAQSDRVVHLFYDQCPAQEVSGEFLVSGICAHKVTGQSHHPRLFQRCFLLKAAAAADTGQGQECGPPVPVLFQILDHLFRRLLIICDDVLDTAA